jgi:4-hydroxythreonine-4-phosphate dehydrogenase
MKRSIDGRKFICAISVGMRSSITVNYMGSTAPTAPLVLALGDPSGIGPEIAAKAWMARSLHDLHPFFVVGDGRAIEAIWSGPIVKIDEPAEAVRVFDTALPLLNIENNGALCPGNPTLEGAQNALTSLEIGVGLARSRAAVGLVTGPVSKAQLYDIGFTHPGQTEFIAERCGVSDDHAIMMLAGRGLRVVPVTVHIPFIEIAQRLSVDLIVQKGLATARAIKKDFGIAQPRIAVAGLNPHAGENGKIGLEEEMVIAPAVARLQENGVEAFGPVSPDALFTPRMRETYDAALCMYHDQALIPLKALFVDDGVNITLGLPIVRTSPDHGTAFDLAGKNAADPSAMIAAIKMASSIAHFRAANP